MAGCSLRLTLDLGLQQEGEKALLEGIEQGARRGKPAVAGAFVALDPRNGQVLAIGSQPSFDPNKFAKPLTESEYHASSQAAARRKAGPLTDRAVNGAYPTGSTFKPITAMAALEGGRHHAERRARGGSCITAGAEQFCNSGQPTSGPWGSSKR